MKNMHPVLRLSVLLSCLFLAGCFNTEKTQQTQESVQKLAVINVLESSLYKDAHIKGSISVPLDKLEQLSRDWPKNTRIVAYCANYMCTASAEAARKLKKLGFNDVFAYEGGTAEWRSKGYPLDGPAKEGYLAKVGQQHMPLPSDVKIINAGELKSEIERAEKVGLLIKK